MRQYPLLVLALIIAGFVFLHVIFINQPFLRHHEADGTQYAKYARNFLKFGFFENRFVCLDVSGPKLDNYDNYRKFYYSDHPPGYSIFIAISFLIFGVSEFSVRIVFLIFAAGCIVLFFAIATRLFGPPVSIVSTAIFALMPIFAYFSMVIAHFATTMFFIFLTLYFYLLWKDTLKTKFFVLMLISQVIACWIDWPGYYCAVVIFVYHFFVEKKRRWLAFVPILLNFVVFGLYVLNLYFLDVQNLYPVKRLFKIGHSRSIFNVDIISYLMSEPREIAIYFTVAVATGVIIWLIIFLAKRIKLNHEKFVLISAFLGLDEILFMQMCQKHDYYTYYLSFFFALAFALFLFSLKEKLKHNVLKIFILLVFIALFVVQSSYFLYNRLTKQGALELYYKMAKAINKKTSPSDRIIIAMDNITSYTPFYADRYYLTYLLAKKEIWIDWGYKEEGVTFEKFKEYLKKNKDKFEYLVTTTPELVARHIKYFKRDKVDKEFLKLMQRFSIYPEHSKFYRFFMDEFGKPVVCDGFLFFSIR